MAWDIIERFYLFACSGSDRQVRITASFAPQVFSRSSASSRLRIPIALTPSRLHFQQRIGTHAERERVSMARLVSPKAEKRRQSSKVSTQCSHSRSFPRKLVAADRTKREWDLSACPSPSHTQTTWRQTDLHPMCLHRAILQPAHKSKSRSASFWNQRQKIRKS